MLVGLVQLEVAGGLGGGPAQDQGDVVDEAGLGELAERVFMVGDVDDGEQDAKVVAALEVSDPRVYILGVEAVVFQTAVAAKSMLALDLNLDSAQKAGESSAAPWTASDTPQEQGTCCQAQAVVGGDVAILPREGLEACEHGIALLAGRDQDRRAGAALREGLRGGLLDTRRGGGIAGRRSVEPLGGGLLDPLWDRLPRIHATGAWCVGGGEGGEKISVGSEVVVHCEEINLQSSEVHGECEGGVEGSGWTGEGEGQQEN